MNINNCIIVGRICQDPELRFTGSGTPVCNINVAVNRTFTKTVDGKQEKVEEATFVPVTVWGKQGEQVKEFLGKGSLVGVEGRLQNRSWETENGEKRKTLCLVAQNVRFGPKNTSKKPSNTQEDPPPPSDEDIPF